MSLRASCVVSPVYILKSLLEPRTRPSDASLEEEEEEEEDTKAASVQHTD
jgi:hypothetical protein